MHNIKTNFDKIHEVLQAIFREQVNEKGNYKRRGTIPRFSDIAVIALSLTAESLGIIDSENYLFSKLHTDYGQEFKNLISRRQFNERRKSLFEKTEQIRNLLAAWLNAQSDVFAINSMPLEICKPSREQRNKWGRATNATAPIMATVLHKKNIFMAISYIVFVRQPG